MVRAHNPPPTAPIDPPRHNMRPSNRTKILDAAARVIQRNGVTGLTFDSVAAEAELTRGGLMYHFRSREVLVESLHEHLSKMWEDSMLELVGKPFEQTTAQERFVAYTQACAQSATRAELLFILDASTSPEHTPPWASILEKWAPPPPDKNSDTAAALALFIARLAGDGLWVYESLSNQPLDAEMRQNVVRELARIITCGATSHLPAPTKEV